MVCESCGVLKATAVNQGFAVCLRCDLAPPCAFCSKGEHHACRPDQFPCSCADEGHPGRDEPITEEDWTREQLFLAGYFDASERDEPKAEQDADAFARVNQWLPEQLLWKESV